MADRPEILVVINKIGHNVQHAKGVKIKVVDYRIGEDCSRCGKYVLSERIISVKISRTDKHSVERHMGGKRLCCACANLVIKIIGGGLLPEEEE